ncbi:MAG TPA: DUF962 domain-containing protein [Candidatus Sulfotelmatobacter sp.]|jgi:uncharacterized membrane protein YGL010W
MGEECSFRRHSFRLQVQAPVLLLLGRHTPHSKISMPGNRTSEQWICQYATSHQHPVNRSCHTLGIPMILLSLAFFVFSIFRHNLWFYGVVLFVIGWILQFVGHAFERKPPEFFSDWRFLFVGVRWWWAKMRGKA